MKHTLAASLLCLLAASAPSATAQTGPGWLRYPSISPDGKTIVFTYKGDLYRVPATGGTAIPLTTHEAHDFMPVWSRDGSQIAFASDRHGNFDVFVIAAAGGRGEAPDLPFGRRVPVRLHDATARRSCSARPAWTQPRNRGFPTGSQPELYRVPAAGGRVEQVLTTPAEDVKVSRDGRFLIYHDKKGGENPWRKHHTSAIARDIWTMRRRVGSAPEDHDLRGRGPEAGPGRRRQGVLLPERGERLVQRPEDEPAGRQPQQVTSFKRRRCAS